MPFTFSHPAIVLPLTYLPRRWVSLTGLVVGSLSPDFEYFLRMKITGYHGHLIPGIFWFDLPLGIFLAFVFHNLVRNGLFDNLPLFLRSRLVQFKNFDWNQYFKKHWPIVMLSIIAGAFSHLFWDAFTHRNGYFVDLLPGLRTKVLISGIDFPVFRILQHVSTLVGALTIAIGIMKLKPARDIQRKPIFKYWFMVIVFAVIVVGMRIASGLHIREYGNVVVTCISATLVGLVLTPIIIGDKFKR